MARVYVGGLDEKISERELEGEFVRFGTLKSVWVARKPPGFAFVEFEDSRDADDAIRKLDGYQGWRVELSRSRGGGGGGRGGGRGGRYDDRGGYGDRDRGYGDRDRRPYDRDGRGSDRRGAYDRDAPRARSRSPVRRSPRRSPSYSPRPRRSPSYGKSVSPARSP